MLINKNSIEVVAFVNTFKLDVKAYSLSSLYRMIKDDNTKFAIISPARNENTKKQNEHAYYELKNLIRNKGLGYVKLKGGYVETDDLGGKHIVEEDSFLINGLDLKTALLWGKKYNQDSILYKDDSMIAYYNCETGKPVNKFKQGFTVNKKVINEYFSKIKRGNRKFAFLAEGSDDCLSNKILDKLNEYKAILIG